MLLVHRLKQLRERANRFGRAQEEKSFRSKGVMKRWHDLFLQTGFEIDQQVAATDEVDARERRVAQEILPGENDRLTQRLADAVATVLLDKESPQPFGRNLLHQRFCVKASTRLVQQGLVEVRRENLKGGRARGAFGVFSECHGQRIGFLAGGTTRHPDANRFSASLLHEGGKDGPFENLEGFRVAEETGHADEQVRT